MAGAISSGIEAETSCEGNPGPCGYSFTYQIDAHPEVWATTGAGQECSKSQSFPAGEFTHSDAGETFTSRVFGQTAKYSRCQPDDEGSLEIGGVSLYSYNGCDCNGVKQTGSGCGGGVCAYDIPVFIAEGATLTVKAKNDCIAPTSYNRWGRMDGQAAATATSCLPNFRPKSLGVCESILPACPAQQVGTANAGCISPQPGNSQDKSSQYSCSSFQYLLTA